jgi:hypothetical protein
MTTKLAVVIVFVMIASLSVAGCATNPVSTSSPTPTPIVTKETVIGNNTTFSSTEGFNITYPKTLQKDSNASASSDVRIIVYLGTNNTTTVSVTPPVALDPNFTLTDFAKFNIGEINNFPDYKLISNNSTTLGGKPAYTIVWQATVPVQVGSSAADVQNQALKVKQTYIVNNNKGYVVSYKALSSDYDKNLAQAQQIMDSFKLTS